MFSGIRFHGTGYGNPEPKLGKTVSDGATTQQGGIAALGSKGPGFEESLRRVFPKHSAPWLFVGEVINQRVRHKKSMQPVLVSGGIESRSKKGV